MAQYSKDIFNLAPGLGRAIADPREAEARAKEASARAEQDLRSQIQARLENQRLQQQQIQLSGQQQLANQSYQQAQLQQQGSQFDRSLQARTQEQAAQREFQRMMQGEQLDSTEARFNAQQGMQADQFAQTFGRQLSRDAVADDQFAQTFGRQLSRDEIGDQRYNAGLEYRDQRDRIGDKRADTALGYQGAQLANQVVQNQNAFDEQRRQFDTNFGLRQDELSLNRQRLNAQSDLANQQVFQSTIAPFMENIVKGHDTKEDRLKLDSLMATQPPGVQKKYKEFMSQYGKDPSFFRRNFPNFYEFSNNTPQQNFPNFAEAGEKGAESTINEMFPNIAELARYLTRIVPQPPR